MNSGDDDFDDDDIDSSDETHEDEVDDEESIEEPGADTEYPTSEPYDEDGPSVDSASDSEIPPSSSALMDEEQSLVHGYEYDPISIDDDDVFGSIADYPLASAEDFEDDQGDWTTTDYADTAKKLFGDHENYGQSAHDSRIAQGYQVYEHDQAWRTTFDQHVPGVGNTVRFYQQGQDVSPLGFISMAALTALQALYPQVNFSSLHVTVPQYGQPGTVQGLPPALANVDPKDAVDLRKYCSPVGDQGQTSRCCAFAWTHAFEFAHILINKSQERLSCNFTMMIFQHWQGDFKGYRNAYKGGDGTEAGPGAGETLVTHGTCLEVLWSNNDAAPKASDEQMRQDARNRRIRATIATIAIDDVRKVLSSGCPVQLSMNTGEGFANLGPDGVFNAADRPSGMHGRHAMLIVGFIGNYYIVKNSWGMDWGDRGYCYIPKKVLIDSDPEFNAFLLSDIPHTHPGQGNTPQGTTKAAVARGSKAAYAQTMIQEPSKVIIPADPSQRAHHAVPTLFDVRAYQAPQPTMATHPTPTTPTRANTDHRAVMQTVPSAPMTDPLQTYGPPPVQFQQQPTNIPPQTLISPNVSPTAGQSAPPIYPLPPKQQIPTMMTGGSAPTYSPQPPPPPPMPQQTAWPSQPPPLPPFPSQPPLPQVAAPGAVAWAPAPWNVAPPATMVACPSCSTMVQSGDYCSICGSSLKSRTYCKSCAGKLPQGVQRCPQCGANNG